jgi:hypothetical protein
VGKTFEALAETLTGCTVLEEPLPQLVDEATSSRTRRRSTTSSFGSSARSDDRMRTLIAGDPMATDVDASRRITKERRHQMTSVTRRGAVRDRPTAAAVLAPSSARPPSVRGAFRRRERPPRLRWRATSCASPERRRNRCRDRRPPDGERSRSCSAGDRR